MTDTDNAAQVIRDLARASAEPRELDLGGYYVLATEHGVERIDLTGDQWREMPKRKKGTVTVADVASFAQYHAKHAPYGVDPAARESEVFADLDNATVTAVLNAHPADGADWQDHRLILRLKMTPQWQTWTTADRQMMPQQQFAEFIEDNIGDIATITSGTASGAELLEMAQHFQAHTKVEFKSGKRLASGDTQFVYSETTEAKAGDRGTISVPAQFEIGIRPFEDCDGELVTARFRYRITDGHLKLGFHLDNPAGKFRDAVAEVAAKTGEACAVKIMRGTPG